MCLGSGLVSSSLTAKGELLFITLTGELCMTSCETGDMLTFWPEIEMSLSDPWSTSFALRRIGMGDDEDTWGEVAESGDRRSSSLRGWRSFHGMGLFTGEKKRGKKTLGELGLVT